MHLKKVSAVLSLVLGGALVFAACGPAGPNVAPTATPTKTPKPTFTATATATETPAFTATPSNTATPVPPTKTPTPVPTDTPEVTNTPSPTDTPVPTNTPNVPPTATRPPAPPTATFTPAPPPTPTPPPIQYTGSVRWDASSANCAFYEIRSASVITDTSNNPVNNVCVCLDLYGNTLTSYPSGPAAPAYKEAGHYDISPLTQNLTTDMTATAFVCDCSTKAALSTDYVTIQFSPANCSPGAGGHQSAIVDWRKNW
ncbi:MAG: hypothetical protein ACYC5O_04575 [Anaerolineae bacterium]